MDTWINPQIIINILSNLKLYKAGYNITYDTKGDWVVYTPEGKSINFKHESGYCEGMTCMNLSETGSEVILLHDWFQTKMSTSLSLFGM